jgi:predicted dinucleotide-binding enzyme
VASWLPGARVVKTLNQVGAEIMANNASMPHRPVMFMASDDPQAKATYEAGTIRSSILIEKTTRSTIRDGINHSITS